MVRTYHAAWRLVPRNRENWIRLKRGLEGVRLGVSKIEMWLTWKFRLTPFFSIRIRISSLTNIDSMLPTD
jgi:hypothetical protein